MSPRYITAIVMCDNCGAQYYLHVDNVPKLPKLHRVCDKCFMPMETVNPLYKQLMEASK